MARKDRKKTIVAHEVVQIPLLPEHAEQIKSEGLTVEAMFWKLYALTLEGYSLTFVADTDDNQYTARLAGIYPECKNASKLLYGNGSTPEKAIVSLYIKHFLVSKGGQWASISQTFSDMS